MCAYLVSDHLLFCERFHLIPGRLKLLLRGSLCWNTPSESFFFLRSYSYLYVLVVLVSTVMCGLFAEVFGPLWSWTQGSELCHGGLDLDF